MASLIRLMRQKGVRKRIVRIRRIKATLAERRSLEAIMREMVELVFSHAAELAEHATRAVTPYFAANDSGIVITDQMEDIDRILQLIVLETQQAMTRLQFRIRNWARNVEERHRRQFAEGVLVATTIDLSTILHPSAADETVEHYITWSTSLIRDLGDEARRRIGSAVLEAVRTRQPPRELAKTIREIHGMSRRRAINIAADQSNKLNNALDRARQREAGIDHFTWRHSRKAHPRPHHQRRDGKVYEWDTKAIRRGDFPGEPPFCGCVAQATLVEEAA
jgi:SPP1 gp7 family putative phage head morphogenesis protein